VKVVSVVDVSVAGFTDAQIDARTKDMIRIPGGTFRMGSDKHYPEEAPAPLFKRRE
jgi:formylglycine-generating enzyme required for sulfatase activity